MAATMARQAFISANKLNLLYLNGLFRQTGLVQNATHRMYNLFQDLRERGLIETTFPDGGSSNLEDHLESPRCVYCGFDPTADSLHIGHLLSVITLLHFKRAGHRVIGVVGGATGMIGDPSGRTTERTRMKENELEHSIDCLSKSLEGIFSNHSDYISSTQTTDTEFSKIRILNNKEFYRNQNIIRFLSTVGRKFRLSSMLSKHSVQTRLQSEEGLSFTEFTYQVFQAYDWLHLFNNYKCTVQIGGNDQLGNMKGGHELIWKSHRTYVYGIAIPLLLDSCGNKLGKSTGNSLWLNSDRTSPYELYQYFLNLPDSDVERYLKLFTFYTNENICEIMKEQNAHPQLRVAQKSVAEQVVLLVHGEAGLNQAQRWTHAFFSKDPQAIVDLNENEIQQLFSFSNKVEILYRNDMTVKETVLAAKCLARGSKAEAVIKDGGVHMNHHKIRYPDTSIQKEGLILQNGITLLRIGKKNYTVIKWLNKVE